jgi:hypothetical protein
MQLAHQSVDTRAPSGNTYGMSKGLGRIERLIERKIERAKTDTPPDPTQICTSELLRDAYPSNDWPFTTFTPAQRKAVTRAMRSYVRKHRRYALTGGQGRKQLFLYEPDDPPSAKWVKMQVANRRRPRIE